ncbi:cytochrome p450 [Moniliophthora roreri]|nr:cytochrome p450 [Moniliophthora roreri]
MNLRLHYIFITPSRIDAGSFIKQVIRSLHTTEQDNMITRHLQMHDITCSEAQRDVRRCYSMPSDVIRCPFDALATKL